MFLHVINFVGPDSVPTNKSVPCYITIEMILKEIIMSRFKELIIFGLKS